MQISDFSWHHLFIVCFALAVVVAQVLYCTYLYFSGAPRSHTDPNASLSKEFSPKRSSRHGLGKRQKFGSHRKNNFQPSLNYEALGEKTCSCACIGPGVTPAGNSLSSRESIIEVNYISPLLPKSSSAGYKQTHFTEKRKRQDEDDYLQEHASRNKKPRKEVKERLDQSKTLDSRMITFNVPVDDVCDDVLCSCYDKDVRDENSSSSAENSRCASRRPSIEMDMRRELAQIPEFGLAPQDTLVKGRVKVTKSKTFSEKLKPTTLSFDAELDLGKDKKEHLASSNKEKQPTVTKSETDSSSFSSLPAVDHRDPLPRASEALKRHPKAKQMSAPTCRGAYRWPFARPCLHACRLPRICYCPRASNRSLSPYCIVEFVS